MTLKFSEASHRYWLDGKPIPGVTTLIKNGIPAPALMYWSARTVAEFVADNPDDVERLRTMGRSPMVAALKETPWQQRDAAGGRGTEVHSLGERLIHGDEVEVPESLAGHVDSYVRFLDEWSPVPVLTERSCAHRDHWYAGRFDLIADMRGERWMLDLKTTRSGIYSETALQLAAYRNAQFYVEPDDIDTEIPMPEVDRCAAVWVRADGYDVVEVDASPTTYGLFRHAAFVARTWGDKKAREALVGMPLTAEEYAP